VVLLSAGTIRAQLPEPAAWAARVAFQYDVLPNIPYFTANNRDLRLDLYLPTGAAAPNPTVVYIHGGGWVRKNKEIYALHVLPYLEMGFSVVSVEYRIGPVSPAPAAVEDCRCLLRWVVEHARQHQLDTKRLVLTGHSAGGHLSLMAGMLPATTEFDRLCPGTEPPRAAAIVSWFGITDVADLLEGANRKPYAVAWLGSSTERAELARRVSPLTYVRAGLPPILMIHGDADASVPYSHSVRLHEELDRVGAPNRLYTIPGGGHGGFTGAQATGAFAAIRQFLARYELLPAPPSDARHGSR
jgi:acetyl esterase/lipase